MLKDRHRITEAQVAGQRKHLFPALPALLSISLSVFPAATQAVNAPDIVPPDPVAIELPAGVSDLGAGDAPIRELIARVQADGFRVTLTLPHDRIGVGVWRAIWSAWAAQDADHPPGGHPPGRRESWLFVLPHGMTPVGSGGAGNAIAGNNTTHIVRDANGSVHMVWYDSWRPFIHEGAQYRRAWLGPDGKAQFQTDVMQLGAHAGTWSSMPTVTAAGNTMHFVWQAEGTARYRSLTRDGDTWRWSDEIDTKIVSPGRDTGPSIAADEKGVHLITPAAIYATSTDGGRIWTSEPVPFGADEHVKTVSLTLDNQGRPLAAASSVVFDPGKYSEDVGHGGYWTVRLARRVAPGKWETITGPVDGRPEWARPSDSNQDVLCDWVRVLEDRVGGIHVTWHGTAASRIYGNDRAYYAWRAPDGAWSAPISLHEPDAHRGFGWSYAPNLTLDGDRALTLSFHQVHVGWHERGFDAELNLFRDGKKLAPELPVTRFAEKSVVAGEPDHALSAWFPGAAPALVRNGDGRVWADILLSLAPTGVNAPTLIVWDRLDLTDWLKSAGQ